MCIHTHVHILIYLYLYLSLSLSLYIYIYTDPRQDLPKPLVLMERTDREEAPRGKYEMQTHKKYSKHNDTTYYIACNQMCIIITTRTPTERRRPTQVSPLPPIEHAAARQLSLSLPHAMDAPRPLGGGEIGHGPNKQLMAVPTSKQSYM